MVDFVTCTTNGKNLKKKISTSNTCQHKIANKKSKRYNEVCGRPIKDNGCCNLHNKSKDQKPKKKKLRNSFFI